VPAAHHERHTFDFEHLQAVDAHTVEAEAGLPDVLADAIFDESEKREQHHALVDKLHAALAAQRTIGAELEANQRARIDVSGGEPPELLDGRADAHRAEAVQRARLALYRFADPIIGGQRAHRGEWLTRLAEEEAGVDERLARAQREYDAARLDKQEVPGRREYVEAMAPLAPNRSHGVVAYDVCTAPKPPTPEPMQQPRTGMERSSRR
jgi:hypothetical protein